MARQNTAARRKAGPRRQVVTRYRVATGADAERERILAAGRDGTPWRQWAPVLDDDRRGALPGISGIVDTVRGMSLTFSLVPETRAADARTVCSMVATPTASYLASIARITSVAAGRQRSTGPRDLEVELRCAKRSIEDVVIRLSVTNRGDVATAATLVMRFGSLDPDPTHDSGSRDPSTDRAASAAPTFRCIGGGRADGCLHRR